MKSLVKQAFICLLVLCSSASSATEDCFTSFCDLNDDGVVNALDLASMLNEFYKDYYIDPEDPNNPYYKLRKGNEQEALFYYISAGLGLFYNEYEDYCNSWQADDTDPNLYAGSNILAEAMVGLDLLGSHPQSCFRSDGLNPNTGQSLYITSPNTPAESVIESINERVGMLLDLDDIHVFRLDDIYEDVGGFNGSSLVLCDVYERTRHSGKKTGMPILYFKARQWNAGQDYQDAEGVDDDIYSYSDNQALLELGTAGNAISQHPLGDGVNDLQDFENMILDKRITVWKMPHRKYSYILVSAGPDGLYGTGDDIFNF